MIKNLLLFNLIIDEYDGEVLKETEAQRAYVECYKKKCPLIAFQKKLLTKKHFQMAKCGESQVVFEEETLSYGRVIDNLKTN